MALIRNVQTQPTTAQSAPALKPGVRPAAHTPPAVDPMAARKAALEARVGMALRELDARVFQAFRNAIAAYDQVVVGTQREREALRACDPRNPTLQKFDRLLKDVDDAIGRWWSA